MVFNLKLVFCLTVIQSASCSLSRVRARSPTTSRNGAEDNSKSCLVAEHRLSSAAHDRTKAFDDLANLYDHKEEYEDALERLGNTKTNQESANRKSAIQNGLAKINGQLERAHQVTLEAFHRWNDALAQWHKYVHSSSSSTDSDTPAGSSISEESDIKSISHIKLNQGNQLKYHHHFPWQSIEIYFP